MVNCSIGKKVRDKQPHRRPSLVEKKKGVMAITPLSMAQSGETQVVKKIHGKDETKRFLESLGFIEGAGVTIVSELAGNLIVNVKDTRVALSKAMANRIMI